ncbi:MAG: hypothetical protein CFH41_00826 [Alphaproteobacteria bacterium MarineAlpha11_Bin1]|nr:MAG: hypothetical protein CFH41_00826 [Alphaproteobacteria bacterium MarineAlpha11_Bin1]
MPFTSSINTMFELDGRLAADTVDIGRLNLCRILLMNDVRYAWLILVPTIPELNEITDLRRDDRIQLSDETNIAANILKILYNPLKINIGVLGNIVRQLHIHVVGRSECDPAWPGPVWGHSPPEPYSKDALEMRVREVRKHLDHGND